MHKKFLALLCATAVVLSAGFSVAAPVGPEPWGSNPGPADNSLDVTATVQGQIVPEGLFLLLFPPVYTIVPGIPTVPSDPFNNPINPTPIQLDPGVHPGGVFQQSSSPVAINIDSAGETTGGAHVTIAGQPNHLPMAVHDLNLDLLNGQTLPLSIETFPLYIWNGNLQQLNIEINTEITDLFFHQTGPGSFNHHTGEYAITGVVKGILNGLVAARVGANPPLIDFELEDQELDIEVTLTGTATSTRLFNVADPLPTEPPGDDILLNLAGNLQLFLPLNESLEIMESTLGAGITSTIDLVADVVMNLSYSFEDVVFGVAIVPEPGTVVLAGIGMLGMIPLVRRRFRK